MKRCVKNIEGGHLFVRNIEGGHLTAADKRNILDCFAYLSKQGAVNSWTNWNQWLGRRGSPKCYRLTPHECARVKNRYRVEIKTNERDDWGQWNVRKARNVIELSGSLVDA